MSQKLVDILKNFGKGAHKSKPVFDKVVDPLAFFTGANIAAAAGLYVLSNLGQTGIEELAKTQFLNNHLNSVEMLNDYYNWISSHQSVEAVGKAALFLPIMTYANAKILPLTYKIFKKKKKANLVSYLKTAGIVALGSLLWFNGLGDGVKSFRNKTKHADSLAEYVNATIPLFRGSKEAVSTITNPVFSGIPDVIKDLYTNYINPDISKDIEKEINRIKVSRPNPNFSYSDETSKRFEKMAKKGYFRSVEEAVYFARVVHWEVTRKKGATLEDARRIVKVALNRYNHIQRRKKVGFKTGVFAKPGSNLFDVMFAHGKNKWGGTTWQFTAVKDNPRDFYSKGMYDNNRINIAVNNIDKKRAKIVLSAMEDVLLNGYKPFGGRDDVLFYKNTAASDSSNTEKKWRRHGRKPLDIKKYGPHTFYSWNDKRLKKAEKSNKKNGNYSGDRIYHNPDNYFTKVTWGKNKGRNSKGEQLFRYKVTEHDCRNNNFLNSLADAFNTWEMGDGSDDFRRATSLNIKYYNGTLVKSNPHKLSAGNTIYVAVMPN